MGPHPPRLPLAGKELERVLKIIRDAIQTRPLPAVK